MPLCPSCGREAGSRVTCPYCGANLKRRLSIALFGVLAIVLAFGGLALLYVVSVNTTIPTIRIAQIQAAMNYATVRIEGLVERSPNFNPDSESLTFWVDDGSGQMLVSAFRSEARALIETDRVPAIGDRVSVEGTLRVRDDVPSLTIAAIDSLGLSRATDSALPRDLGMITPDDALTGVTVRGQVRAVREPRSSGSLRLVTLRDTSGEIDVVIEADVAAFGAAPNVAIGDSIEVTGVVTLFEGAPQVTLTRGQQLSVLSEPVAIAESRPIRGLGDDDIGGWVRVQGAITRIAPFSAGVKFTLSDAQGQDISLLLWQDVFDSLPDAADWQIGAQVAAQGQVNSFRGELELVPEIALDVSILGRAVAEAPPMALSLRRIGTITQDDVGRSVFVSGTIQSADRFSAGVRFQLEDDSGSIRLVLFSDVYAQVENGDRLDEGMSVSALGRVSEFDGALEVIPPNGASVRVAASGLGAIAQITPLPRGATLTPTPPGGTPVSSGTTALTATRTPTPGTTPTPTAIASATLTASATPALTATGVTAIGSIDASRVGQTVTVRGQVIATSSFSAGFRFTLNDGTGSIPLVLFDGRYREVANRAALNLGAQVAVTATVVEFNGELEAQPVSGRDVVVERPGSSSIVKARAINTLSGADVGTLAAIVGNVLRVEGFGSPQVGVSVFVNDGTAELRVVIWNNVLNFVPNAPALQPGATVRVAGRIDEFNGVLELVPALGYDVTINP